MTRLHQKTLRLLILSWYCSVRFQEAELHQQFSQPLQRGDRRSARQFAARFLLRHDLRHFLQLSHHLRHAVPEEVAVALVPVRPTSRPRRPFFRPVGAMERAIPFDTWVKWASISTQADALGPARRQLKRPMQAVEPEIFAVGPTHSQKAVLR